MKQTVLCLVFCLVISNYVQLISAQVRNSASSQTSPALLSTLVTPTQLVSDNTISVTSPAVVMVSTPTVIEHAIPPASTKLRTAETTHIVTPSIVTAIKPASEHVTTLTLPVTPTLQAAAIEEHTKEKAKPEEMPEAPVEKEASAVAQEKVAQELAKKEAAKLAPTFEEEGIDTYEQEGGNWLLKRQALEKTMDVIEKIKDTFTKILESRIDYLVKRNKIDRSFDLFSNKIGFELGDLNKLLSTLLQDLKSQRKDDGDLTEEERQVLTDIETKITELKDLRITVRSITDLDASLDDTIMQLEKEIDTSNSYQNRAWRNFQTIKKVLSDEKAEELYLQTESLLKNMQEILLYLKGDLATYFNSVINNLRQSMDKVEASIKELDAKGIKLVDEVKKIKKAEKLKRKKKQQEQVGIKPEAKNKKAEAKQAVAAQPNGWYSYVRMLWIYPLSIITSAGDYVMNLFVTKKIEPKKLRPVEVESEKKAAQNKTKKEFEAQEVKKK